MVEKDPVSGRRECLDSALECVTQDRNASYGEPEDNFKNIADIWNAQGVRMWADSHGAFADENRLVTSVDVALMMVGMKLARLRFNPAHKDSWIDMAGYAACGMECSIPVDKSNVIPMFTEDAISKAIHSIHSVREDVISKGWVSKLVRCVDAPSESNKAYGHVGAEPHSPHAYGMGNNQWCDGYI